MDDEIDRKPQTEKVVVERERTGSGAGTGVLVAVLVIGILLLIFFASGMFGGGQETTPDVEVNTPTETTPTVPTPDTQQ